MTGPVMANRCWPGRDPECRLDATRTLSRRAPARSLPDSLQIALAAAERISWTGGFAVTV